MGIPVLVNAQAYKPTRAAQSCRTGGIGTKSIALGIKVEPVSTNQHKIDLPPCRETQFDKATELEAFSVRANPSWGTSLLGNFARIKHANYSALCQSLAARFLLHKATF